MEGGCEATCALGSGKAIDLACTGQAFHHQSRAAEGDVRNNGGSAMDFGDDA